MKTTSPTAMCAASVEAVTDPGAAGAACTGGGGDAGIGGASTARAATDSDRHDDNAARAQTRCGDLAFSFMDMTRFRDEEGAQDARACPALPRVIRESMIACLEVPRAGTASCGPVSRSFELAAGPGGITPGLPVMTLAVIGSGFGRTGTKSLKEALEVLGFGPCHHMHEILMNPPQVAHWQALAAGEAMDWGAVFAGYGAQVDWPGAHVWRELAEAYPQARVVHTVRSEDAWWASFTKTIAKLTMTYPQMTHLPPHAHAMLAAWEGFAGEGTFGRDYTDKDKAVAAYRLRTEQVREAIPADRLLVFNVAEGWEPLCRFLDRPVPDTPFPHHNLRDDFWEVLGGEPA
jgi:hypothetical protein